MPTCSIHRSPSLIPLLQLLSRPHSLLMHSFIIACTPDRKQCKRQNRLHCVPVKARETWLPSIGHVLNGLKSPRTVNKSDRQHNCSALKPLRWLYYFIFFHQTGINQVYTPPTHRSPIHRPLLLIPHWVHVLHARLHSIPFYGLYGLPSFRFHLHCVARLQPVCSFFLILSLISSLFSFTKKMKRKKTRVSADCVLSLAMFTGQNSTAIIFSLSLLLSRSLSLISGLL